MKIHKDDLVLILKGKDRGLSGKVLRVDRSNNKIVVAGINIVKRHVKKSNKYPEGGIIENPGPISVSNVCLMDPKTKDLVKVSFKIDDSKKSRILSPKKNKSTAKSKPNLKAKDPKTGEEEK